MKRLWEIKYNNRQVFIIDGETSRLRALNLFIKYTNDNNIKIDNIYSIRNVSTYEEIENNEPLQWI